MFTRSTSDLLEEESVNLWYIYLSKWHYYDYSGSACLFKIDIMFEGTPRQNQMSVISGFDEYSNGKDYKKRQSIIRVGNLGQLW